MDINTKHVMQVATTDDEYSYVITNWGYIVLEEKDILYFSKNFFHTCPSRGRFCLTFDTKSLVYPFFLCGKNIVFPI
jgi:hypothetical protein